MKTKSILLVAILLAALTTSSRCVSIGNGITPSKNYITRDFKVGDFDKLDISTVADISYTQSTDNSTSLQIYGSDNLVELLKVDVKDSTLIISAQKRNINKSDLKIRISSPTLQHVKTSGVGNFNIKERVEATNLTIKNDGVGDVKINDVTCTELNIRTEGVGNVSVKGKAEKVSLISQGVGNINASELESDSVIATSDGVGNISCYAKKSINAKVNGVGNISYKGNPTDKQLKKNGIGSIKHK